MAPADTYAMEVAASLPQAQQNLFYGEYNRQAKSYNTALLLAIFTGWWLGGHNFYLGRTWRGVLHIILALLSLTLIPLILTIIDIVNLHKTVDRINERAADEVAAKIRAMPLAAPLQNY
jgi:TM2 domain-containing membrane protein YozV